MALHRLCREGTQPYISLKLSIWCYFENFWNLWFFSNISIWPFALLTSIILLRKVIAPFLGSHFTIWLFGSKHTCVESCWCENRILENQWFSKLPQKPSILLNLGYLIHSECVMIGFIRRDNWGIRRQWIVDSRVGHLDFSLLFFLSF